MNSSPLSKPERISGKSDPDSHTCLWHRKHSTCSCKGSDPFLADGVAPPLLQPTKEGLEHSHHFCPSTPNSDPKDSESLEVLPAASPNTHRADLMIAAPETSLSLLFPGNSKHLGKSRLGALPPPQVPSSSPQHPLQCCHHRTCHLEPAAAALFLPLPRQLWH